MNGQSCHSKIRAVEGTLSDSDLKKLKKLGSDPGFAQDPGFALATRLIALFFRKSRRRPVPL